MTGLGARPYSEQLIPNRPFPIRTDVELDPKAKDRYQYKQEDEMV